MSAAEFEEIQRRAADQGMTPSTFLGVLGLREDTDPRRIGGGLTVADRRVLSAELDAVQTQMRGAARNLNQVTAMAHSRGEVPPAIIPVTARLNTVLAATERLVARLSGLVA